MKIAVGNSRMDKKWKNQDISWADLCARCGSTIRTTETVEEYRKLKKGQQDGIKDVGGFVGGHLREGRRKNGMVLCRSLLTLDMDYGTPDIWEEITLFHDFKCCVYSTHKHTPEHPRLRLLIPLKREISEEEYPAVARMVAKEIGIDLFDDTTYEASRLMYWPSTSANGEFFYKVQDGAELDPDEYLSRYDDWHDASTWPVSSRQSEVVQHSIAQQADPLTKPGVVEAFCRAYTVEEAIDTFLSDMYAPSAMNGRYDYIPADSSAGVIVYDGKFAYSHHATDPVCGRLLNAFDLVRLHRFRDLDDKCAPDTAPGKLPSFQAMSDFALKDEKVKAVFAEERKAQASEEFSDEDWQKALELDKAGKVKNTLQNLTVILMNDPLLKPLVFNQLLDGMEIKGDVPWRHPSKFWRDADDAQLISYVDSHYSTLKVTPGTATAKNGASISNYTASCNGLSSSNTTGSALSVGKIAKSGSVTVTLTVTDSRGYTASVSQTITVIPYAKPKVSSVTLRRTNDIEAEMQLKFSGSISAVTVDGTQKNSVVYVRYRYKKTSESSYGSYTSIYSGTTKSGTSFSYSNLELCSLDANSSYDLHLQIQDKLYSLSSLDLYFTVPQGTPLIALRKKKVGINTPEPQAMLDVAGDMRVDGSPLADFVIQQGTSGIWNYRKWKSGTAECWGQYSFTTAISTAWGVLYESGAIALPNFPFTFAEIPHVHISTENSNYAMFVERGSSSSWSTTTNPGKIFAVRPNTVPSATYKVSIYAIGKV